MTLLSIRKLNPHPIQLHSPDEAEEGAWQGLMPTYITRETDGAEEDQRD